MKTNKSGYQANIDFLSHLIDSGKVFYRSAVAAALAVPSVTHWKTGSKPVYFKTIVTASVKTTLTISEGATCSADGTETPLLNRNRSFPDVGLLFKRFSTPTVTDAGTTIVSQIIGTQGTSKNIGADEIAVLKPNTSYIATITPSAASDISIDLLFWEDQ